VAKLGPARSSAPALGCRGDPRNRVGGQSEASQRLSQALQIGVGGQRGHLLPDLETHCADIVLQRRREVAQIPIVDGQALAADDDRPGEQLAGDAQEAAQLAQIPHEGRNFLFRLGDELPDVRQVPDRAGDVLS
jgi:hypothetical protein